MVSAIYWWLIFFIFSKALLLEGYSLDYKGFDNCGIGGWHCSNSGSDYVVTYDCTTSNVMVSNSFYLKALSGRYLHVCVCVRDM